MEVVGIALAKNGQIGWCFDELDEWGWGMFGEIRASGPGFRMEEMLVRDFVRGRSDKRSPAAPVRELQAERWVVPEGPDDGS